MVKREKPQALQKLDAFVGNWITSGQVLSAQNATLVKGMDSYEWLPGGYFLFHRVDVMMGVEREQSIEIIGYDESRNVYPMHFYDSHGISGTMEATENDGTWTFQSDHLRFMRSFSEWANILTGTWYQGSINDSWLPWLEIRLEKQ